MQDSWNPQQYEKFKAERAQPFYDLQDLLARNPTPEQVIDLGCGTGELTRELHGHLQAKHTVGMDASDKMLEKAGKFADSSLEFTKGDIQTWAPKAKYDVIFSNAAIQWCTNHPQIFKNLSEALRPGGQLAVQMPMNHDYPTHLLAQEMSREPKWAGLLGVYEKEKSMLSVEEYAHLLFKLGFRQQSVELKVYSHILDSREGVIEWVRGTLLTYFESRLSPADFQGFVTEFRERLFRILPDERPFFYPFKRVLIWAKL